MRLIQAGAITLEQVGSYAGLAAVLGLAVLSALYFSQARDVKRLRDWAGRAPERDAEARSRVAAATPAGQAQAAADGSGNSGEAAQTPTPAAQPAVAAQTAAAAAAPAAATATASKAPVIAPAARALGRPSSAQTSVLSAQAKPRERWYRRIAPRYIALIVAGVLVVGGGIAVGAVQLLSNSSPSRDAAGGRAAPQSQTPPERPASAPLRPADVSVAILNATAVPGLADQFGDKAQAQGFQKDNVGNAPGGQRAESVVLYAPGKEREAKLVRRKFGVSNIEPIDPESMALAPQADAVLVIGADNTQ